MHFTIQELDKNKRLDKFLAEKLPTISRSQLQKLVKSGSISVNGKTVPPHHFLKPGDTIVIHYQPSANNSARLPKTADLLHATCYMLHVTRPLPNPSVSFRILHKDPQYLIIDKPAGLIIHQSEIHQDSDTLVNGLLVKYPELINIGEGAMRPGIVHRLDKDASGVLAVARTNEMFSHLKQQFVKRKVKKVYLALVHGVILKPEGIIDFPISRSKTSGEKMAAHSKEYGGRESVTEYEVVKSFQHSTLVKVRIKTGRTHQIRVHFNAFGHPVAGEAIYISKKFSRHKMLNRLFLHSCELGFYDLEKKWQEFKSELPEELENFLKTLR